MHNSKFIQLLKSCSKKELQSFYKFTQSPYFTTNVKIGKLFGYIRKYAPAFESRMLDRHKMFAFLFPGEAYQEIKLQKYMSDLVGLLEQFWVYEELHTQEALSMNITLAKVYHQRDYRHYWEKEVEGIQKKIAQAKLKDASLYYDQFQFNLAIHHAIEEEGQRDQEPNLQNVFDQLDYFYLINKLKYYYKAINFQEFKSHEYDYRLIEPILTYIEANEIDVPAIQIYYYGIRCYTDLDHADYFVQLKTLLKAHVNDFDQKENQAMFSIAINYCILQINKGDRDFIKEIFELYQFEITEGIIIEDGKIPAATYRNITTTASLLDELDWLEHFLEEYKEGVDEKDYALNVAQLYFRQARYSAIIQLFKAADYDDVLFMLSAKAILLKTAYELRTQFIDDYDYEEKLDAELTNFNTFLHRKKRALPKHYIFYLNLTRNLRELFRLTQEADLNQPKLIQLEEQVRALKEIAEKRWLLQKIRELVG